MPAPPSRAEQAFATRRRMIESGYRLFCENGYLGTTMKAIASGADVAVQTVYYTFHTKAAVLDEVIGAAVLGFDDWRGPVANPDAGDLMSWHAWWPAFEEAETAAEALDVFATHGVAILERVGPLVTAMHGAAGDPEAEIVVRTAEARRIESFREAIRGFARKRGGLRRGVSQAAAVDIASVLLSAEVYQALASGRGWSARRCATFFRQLLASQLLAPNGG